MGPAKKRGFPLLARHGKHCPRCHAPSPLLVEPHRRGEYRRRPAAETVVWVCCPGCGGYYKVRAGELAGAA